MISDTFLDRTIEQKFIEQNDKERENHKSSGKLSASQLNNPLQWQILKVLEVPQKELEEYVLRKFFRGKQIENWLVSEMPDILETQKLIEYNRCIGFADVVVDTKNWDFKVGIIPAEIKSVSNAKFRRILSGGGADKGHILQAAYYALGMEKEQFAVIYCASDDLRIKTLIYQTKDYRPEIDGIIDLFYKALESKIIPVFEARESWQSNLAYNQYPDFMKLSIKELQEKYNQLTKK